MSDTATGRTSRSICVISEDLSYPIDEGIRHFAGSLIEGWSRENRVLGISARSRGRITIPNIISLRTNKFFLSYRLFTRLRRFKPDVICYVPTASATIFSFLRVRMLKFYYPGARVAMVSLQPRSYGRVSRQMVKRLCPDIIFVQDETSLQQLADLGCKVKQLASGVDLEKFTPVNQDRKTELRTKYGLDPESFTVLHVGHITGGRNIELLAEVSRQASAQVILVASSLVHKDTYELLNRLRGQGIKIFNDYISDIEEIYQLSDCYLFPVFSDQSCVGAPLSVLEAMACNLPVVSVRFGMLPHLFKEGQGFFFADNAGELLQRVAGVKNINGCRTRDQVAECSWEKVADDILEQTGATTEIHT